MSGDFSDRKDGELAGKVALITGAASGIGLAITRRFVKEKALVAMVDRNIEKLNQSREELLQMDRAAQILPVPCDITNEADVVEAVKTIAEHFGRLNIAVNNAGVSVSVPSDECTLEQWNWVMSVNCTGSFLISREAIKVFKRQPDGGALVFINSDDALKPSRHFLAYNSSKAAVFKWPAPSPMNLVRITFAPTAFFREPFLGGAACGRRNFGLPGQRSTVLIQQN